MEKCYTTTLPTKVNDKDLYKVGEIRLICTPEAIKTQNTIYINISSNNPEVQSKHTLYGEILDGDNSFVTNNIGNGSGTNFNKLGDENLVLSIVDSNYEAEYINLQGLFPQNTESFYNFINSRKFSKITIECYHIQLTNPGVILPVTMELDYDKLKYCVTNEYNLNHIKIKTSGNIDISKYNLIRFFRCVFTKGTTFTIGENPIKLYIYQAYDETFDKILHNELTLHKFTDPENLVNIIGYENPYTFRLQSFYIPDITKLSGVDETIIWSYNSVLGGNLSNFKNCCFLSMLCPLFMFNNDYYHNATEINEAKQIWYKKHKDNYLTATSVSQNEFIIATEVVILPYDVDNFLISMKNKKVHRLAQGYINGEHTNSYYASINITTCNGRTSASDDAVTWLQNKGYYISIENSTILREVFNDTSTQTYSASRSVEISDRYKVVYDNNSNYLNDIETSNDTEIHIPSYLNIAEFDTLEEAYKFISDNNLIKMTH